MNTETKYKLLQHAAEKGKRSLLSHIDSIDWKGNLALPTVFWAGIDSPGGYEPSVSEWVQEVAKRVFRKMCVEKLGMSHADATWHFYN